MKFIILYKTTNLVNKRVYWGIHETSDLFFGTPDYSDPYIGHGGDLNSDLKRYGRRAFVVEAIQGFDDMDKAKNRLQLYTKDLNNSYNKPIVFTEERRKHLSELNLAEKNPFYGKKHSEDTKKTLKSFRSSVKWVKNDAENVEKQIDKNDPIPDGYTEGRLFRKRNKKKPTNPQ